MARAEARRVAVQLIYESMLGGVGGEETMLNLLGFLPSSDDAQYIESVVSGVFEKSMELDEEISKLLKNWTIERLTRVDLSILRLGAFEILYREDVPTAVAVNEAVELSHVFSTEESSGFINGVLGNLARQKGI